MGRIRTVKPDLFRNYKLFRHEQESGLPLRVAFIGLFTSCDKEGRFIWEPETIKLDCLPHDKIDFSRVLDALWTRHYIIKYALNGKEYGAIPTWKLHQHINNRENESILPQPTEDSILEPLLTRESRVDDASQRTLISVEHASSGEGKGREGKGSRVTDSFEKFWEIYPKKKAKGNAEKAWLKIKPDSFLEDKILEAVRNQKLSPDWQKDGGTFIPFPASWLNAKRWQDEINGNAPERNPFL